MPISKIVSTLVVLVVSTVFIGCGPGPKSQQLEELERTLQDPRAREVKEAPGANKPYREARQYRRLALESWEEGREDRSKEYALLGTLRYRTAEAIAEQNEHKQRLDKANARIDESNPEIKALNQERNKLAKEVQDLEREVAQARRKSEERDRLTKANQQRANMGSGGTNDSALRQQLQNELRRVEDARKDAQEVDAATHAPQQFNRADNQLTSIRTMMTNNNINAQLVDQARSAAQLFQQAKTEAQPKYEEALQKAKPEARRASLRSEGANTFGSPYVVTEPNGARIIMAGLFEQGSATISPSKQVLVEELVKLALKYDEFTIFIEGFTAKTGSATENLGLSQLRARAIKDTLTAKGVKASRIDTRGLGQDRVRYPSDRALNDRVEVVFSRYQ